jgi:hypothetical protein
MEQGCSIHLDPGGEARAAGDAEAEGGRGRGRGEKVGRRPPPPLVYPTHVSDIVDVLRWNNSMYVQLGKMESKKQAGYCFPPTIYQKVTNGLPTLFAWRQPRKSSFDAA